MVNRRDFLKGLAGTAIALSISQKALAQPQRIYAKEFTKLPSTDYFDMSHSEIEWKKVSEGLYFDRVNVYRGKELVDIVAALKINPELNKIRVFNGFNPDYTEVHDIEGWQQKTSALAMVNSAQYMADPYYMPCGLVICDGKQKGPKFNKTVTGMLVAEPKETLDGKIKKADLLDFDYDKFDSKTTPYQEGVQHWPILLDREGRVKAGKSLWQANRTVVAKTKEDEMLFLTTEGGFFTLYNFGRFLKESNSRQDKGFNVHTAMNMDGGYEADMVVKTPQLSYVTYGEFETYGPGRDATVFNMKIRIPGVIGVFAR